MQLFLCRHKLVDNSTKPGIKQSSSVFSFKSDQRAERRKEARKHVNFFFFMVFKKNKKELEPRGLFIRSSPSFTLVFHEVGGENSR